MTGNRFVGARPLVFDGFPPELRALLPGGEGGTVDVVVFSRAFGEWARASGRDVDLIAAGMLARRAWEALRAETEALLARESSPEPEAAASPPDAWMEILAVLEEAYDPGARFDRAIAAGASPLARAPLRPPPRSRHVTLADLVAALESAQVEADHRERAHAGRRAAPRQDARASVVDEDPSRDIERVLARLPPAGEERALGDLAETRAPVDRVAAFQAVLQLAAQRRVGLRQDDFPTSTIYVRRLAA